MSKAFLKKAVFFALFVVLFVTVKPQQIIIPDNLETPIPVDPEIRKGKFGNGMTYYIKKNSEPKNRAELHLVVNAGSILEDDDQQGLAHFVEHMAFNGTKNFEKNALINYLESIGMRFGADLNAYTSFDETVYMLTVPLDQKEFLDTAFMILHDWAFNLAFEPQEIDKERGVIYEEWRMGQGAQDRMSREYLPVIFHNSQYANRLPIGTVDIIQNAPYDAMIRFYKEWYRPELMALVAVGDFDVDNIEQYIITHFSEVKNPQNVRERKLFELPDHNKPLVSIVSDKENPYNLMQVYFKVPADNTATHQSYRNTIVESLYVYMLSNRIGEIMETPNPPFLFATSAKSPITREKDAFLLIAAAKNNRSLESLERLLVENERIRRHGFTETELERTKVEFLRNMEKSYREKDQQKSINYASEYRRNFLLNESIPGIEYEYEMYKKFLPGISVSEVNELSNIYGTPENAVVIMTFPEKKDLKKPKAKDVVKLFKTVSSKKDIAPYIDDVSDLPLISMLPDPTPVINEKELSEYDAIEWTLENGAKVIVKKTDFQNDEILMSAFSFGGSSLYPDEDMVSAYFADDVISSSGISGFDNSILSKMLSGKIVSVSPYISSRTEGLSGNASPDDFETLLQLTHLYFTSPRKDEVIFQNVITTHKDLLKNKVSPEQAFQDTLTAILSNYHKRAKPLQYEDIDQANHERMMQIYKDRFADASDFTFIFVGNIDIETAKPLIEQYIGSLPSNNSKESFVDHGIRKPDKAIEREVRKGIEPKATVFLAFPGKIAYNYQNEIKMNLMSEILNIRLREIIREDEGGVYGIQAWANMEKYPVESHYVGVYFGCAPENVEKFIAIVKEEIQTLQTKGSDDVNLAKVIETAIRDREKNQRENRFWMNSIMSHYLLHTNPADFINHDNIVKSTTNEDVINYAKKHIDLDKMIKVVLLQEK